MRVALYRTVRLIRRFEERAMELARSGEIVGGIHPYIGQEAVAAGCCAALRDGDVITSTHRGHGHVLAKGAEPARLMAELAGRVDGLNRGRGGSMHAADVRLGILGANGIVGAGAPIAVGAAWASRRTGGDHVALSFFGEGALNQGVLLESFNLAALWRLPVVFVCENNGYAVTTPIEATTAGRITDRVGGFGIRTSTVDGMDPEAVRAAAIEAVEHARDGHGPAFLECLTYRFDDHHTRDRLLRLTYRTAAEIADWQARDPVELQGSRLDAATRTALDADVESTLDEAVAFAMASPAPDLSSALDHLYATRIPVRPGLV